MTKLALEDIAKAADEEALKVIESIIENQKRGIDPKSIRPRRDWAVVLQDRRKSVLSSGLIIPEETNHEKLHEGSGTIIRLNAGPVATAGELKEGDRVMYRTYLRHARKLPTEQKWEDGEPMEFFLVSVDDFTAVLEPGVEIGLLSEKK